jgi:hypothetical protein
MAYHFFAPACCGSERGTLKGGMGSKGGLRIALDVPFHMWECRLSLFLQKSSEGSSEES